ncbi:hypothetical protein VP01_3211g5 [Puccinia sorghi]|uniref:Uncharacterized protein n=1 Tax=Puccinia sorghi TaxID=27349 RepID=A0A0L6UYC3_9BASI|nr:hypothetical protein VP01_3211g5 [Puccinia sorghi]
MVIANKFLSQIHGDSELEGGSSDTFLSLSLETNQQYNCHFLSTELADQIVDELK